MSVTTSTNKATFTQAGTTTEFSLEVKCFSTAEVKVFTKINGVQAEVTTGITKTAVSGDLDNGVTVTFDTAPAVGTDIILIREIDETQILELSEGGNLSAQALEDALDRGVIISQQIVERFDRSIQFPVSDEDGTTYDVGPIEARANKALGFDADGNVTELSLASAGAIGVDTSKGLVLSNNVISGKADDTTIEFSSGNIAVKAGGIGATQLASTLDLTGKTVSLSGAGITNGTVTKAKIENVASMKVLGNVTGSAAAPSEVAVLDEDDMASDSATAIPTQQSVKAYVDAPWDSVTSGTSADAVLAENGYQKLPSGLILQWGYAQGSTTGTTVNFNIPFPNAVLNITATEKTQGNLTISTTVDGKSAVYTIDLASFELTVGSYAYWMAIGY